jgi:hypothetical protein
MCIEETNVNEPLMKCRKRRNDVKIGRQSLARDKIGSYLNCGLVGIRHKDGVNSMQASKWNLGTCRSDVKREAQEPKLKCESIDAEHRGGAGRSSDEGSVMELEQRTCVTLSRGGEQLAKGGFA